MKKMLSLCAIATVFAVGAAFADKADTAAETTWENAFGQPISESQYLNCPGQVLLVCGRQLQDGQVVETRFFI